MRCPCGSLHGQPLRKPLGRNGLPVVAVAKTGGRGKRGGDRNLPYRQAGYVGQRHTMRNRHFPPNRHLVFHLIGDLELRRLTSHGERTQKRVVQRQLKIPSTTIKITHFSRVKISFFGARFFTPPIERCAAAPCAKRDSGCGQADISLPGCGAGAPCHLLGLIVVSGYF